MVLPSFLGDTCTRITALLLLDFVVIVRFGFFFNASEGFLQAHLMKLYDFLSLSPFFSGKVSF